MTSRNARIKQILKVHGVTQSALAERLGVSHATVNERLNKNEDIDSIAFIDAVAELTGTTALYVLTGQDLKAGLGLDNDIVAIETKKGTKYAAVSSGTKKLMDLVSKGIDVKDAIDQTLNEAYVNENQLTYLSGKTIRPVTVVVNQSGKELMSYVPVKAQAGYMKGYGDPNFLEKLPAFSLPILKDGAYRMFEVDGDSMLQLGGGGLHDGDIVIAQYLEDIFTLRDNRVYVVISTEGVVVKRVLNRLKDKENPVLICNSDNKNGQYSAIILRAHEILEVWELKAFISRQLSFSTDLWQVINDLQVQHTLLKEKVDHMEGNKLLP